MFRSVDRAASTALIVGFAMVSVLGAQTMGDGGGPWSLPISGVQARFSFETGDLFNGTRITRIFLELRNTTGVLNPICMLYDPIRSIKAQLYDAAGKPASVGPSAASIFSAFPFLICLPYKGTLRFDVTAYGYGVAKDKKALIGLHSRAWVIEKADPSEYFLGGVFVAERPLRPLNEKIWTGRIEIPKARVDALPE
jgi:hypothetical protein